MGKSPRFIHECPNVENTLPLELFRAQSPARYSQGDGDKMVLYAGNGDCSLEILATSSIHVHEKLRAAGSSVAVFVLDTSVVLWFLGMQGSTGLGVELPYPLIALHALKDVEGESVLYLQVLSCELFQSVAVSEYTQTVELILRAGRPGQQTSLLFYSPLLVAPCAVPQLYEALGTCSALHYDSEPESETDGFGADHEWITADHEWITADSGPGPQLEMPASWVNSGDADDLGMADPSEENSDGEAGMNVAVGYVTVAGVVRRRSSVSREAQKQRRIG
ncbi:hypothetical protein METBIDRAFT_39751 [Metschnikowia bicuspidata var. bicuspidata NRRL YB-4993]|uniref:Protein LOT5 n=1 Tax=Metschnikowia bicuspidata var. bicuspidata NRRL YB-4993 TaxID=869754 RepID=A0A1A0HDM3_9ASCO|nr:hypothetical protein METBIDRAFT_39751 [Metschnikowia bicuspidata var. bicuspidata NRRL YB-4993]OBA22116.1 hypothetical protein METBIDRAFT_39751 [Metschnikowia bicuspidata var. bicuspidata NRRL YB-4993]